MAPTDGGVISSYVDEYFHLKGKKVELFKVSHTLLVSEQCAFFMVSGFSFGVSFTFYLMLGTLVV